MPITATRKPPPITVDEFLNSTDRLGPGRHILVDGVIYAMVPPSATHGIIQLNVGSALKVHLQSRAMPCQVMGGAGVQPRLHKKTNVRIPDITVACGPAPGPDDRLVTAPQIVVEVLSPSHSNDSYLSINACATIPSVMEMLAIDSSSRTVEYWQRGLDGAWPDEPSTIVGSGVVTFASIDISLSLADIYAGTHLSEA